MEYGRTREEGLLPRLRRKAALQRTGTRLHPLSLRHHEAAFEKTDPRRPSGAERSLCPSPMNKKILVAEDMQATREVVRFLLSNRGFDVIEATNGIEALERTRSQLPDLLILDSDMPEKSGYDVLRALKYDDACKKIPVLFLVASADAIDVTRSIPSAEFLVPKPFTAHDLLQRVLKVLG